MKKTMKIVLAFIVSIIIAIPLIVMSKTVNEDPTRIQLEDLSDTYSGSDFKETYYLNVGSGKDVNFWVKNTGESDILISLDGKGLKEPLAAGEEGEVTSTSGLFSRSYNFKVVSKPKGENMEFEYRIKLVDKK